MKHIQTFLLLTALPLTTLVYAQDTKSSPPANASGAHDSPQASSSPAPTIASAIDREISIVEKELIDAAEAMPEGKFDFSPEKLNLPGSDYKGVRTFGEQLKHVAASNYLIWSPITGDKTPDNVNEGKGPENMKAKADIIKFLKDSFAFGHKAVATLNDSNLVQPIIRNNKPPTTRLFLATFAPAHAFDHYGQIVEISPDERDRATGEPRPVVHAGIKSPGWARLAVALLIPCADVPEIGDGLIKDQSVKRLVVTADQHEA